MRIPTSASTVAIACSLALFGGCPAAAAQATQATLAQQVPTQLPTNVRPIHYTIKAVPDAATLSFGATATIDIEVLEPTDSITLNAVDLSFGAVTLADAAGTTIQAARTDIDAGKQIATFRFAETVRPGRYRVTAAYSGKINTQAAGLFALDYESPEGRKRALYTQFEAPDARRFFPGWDEPNFRTPYDLTVTVPAGQTAVSNMPEVKREARADGSKVITFQTTPPMSSYLLFLGMGEFDRITTQVGGTEIGVVTKKGDSEKGRFALEGSAQILPYYNDYFGTPYPLPKLDNVAGPGSSQFFGAMENWGAIFSFESILLVDPAITTEATRQRIFSVAAHEMAHQWFGDLVTMAWWNDLWLNEGFASWMASKATNVLHPEWEPLLGRIDGREEAIELDSVASTHPIVQNISTVEQIVQAFDSITYRKGEAVITMLEDYVGEDAWRRGVRDYMATYRLKNTVTDNLWGKVEQAAGKPITAIAHDFTLQPGVPLIRVENAVCSKGKTQATLRQAEFTRDRSDKRPLSWRVPVIASTLGGGEARTLVSGGTAAVALDGCGPLLVNSGQTGYYRTLYAPALLDRLTASYAQLKPVDQIGLLADNWGLGLAGYQSPAEALDMIDAVPANANPQLWTRAAGILGEIHAMYAGDPRRQALLSRYATKRLSPVLARLGWKGAASELSTDGVLRAELIGTLGTIGDADVVAEAKRRYVGKDESATSGPLRRTILGVVASNIDAAGWERLRTDARTEKNELVRSGLYHLLGSARDETLARRALDLALTEEPGATNSSQIIGAVAAGHPDLAFDFALKNRDKVESLVDASSRSVFLPELAAGSSNRAMVAKLQDFAERHMTKESRRPADIAIASIEDRVRVRETRLPDITRWLELHAR
jgi:aminopeptidase N